MKWGFLLQAFLVPVGFATSQETPSDFGIFDWIHNSRGGYFNPKQEFRYETPGDSSTLVGVFATDTIKKGETLVKVPWSLVLTGDDQDDEGQMCCGTVEALAREMRLGAESKYGPYVEYLNAQPAGQLPSAWSEEGQTLLREVVGTFLDISSPMIPPDEPTEWLTYDWYGRCEGDPEDTLSAKAALLVVQRSDDYYLIPGYDMYNHRNGKWMNSITTTKHGESHVTRAMRDIEPGEQIYISYNRCRECQGRVTNYGTAEILRDYGFIERFPQEWHYYGGMIQFTIDEDPEDGRMLLSWNPRKKQLDDDEYADIVSYLKKEILRLRRIRNLAHFNSWVEKVPPGELETIWEFLEANIVAMSVAIEAIESDFLPAKEKEGIQPACPSEIIAVNGTHYDTLEYEADYLDYAAPTCNNGHVMRFTEYETLENMRTNYQKVEFAMDPNDGDICMDIENIVQICSVYRPQYHEYVVHAAARFVDPIKRVIFIGGGDSMLLHEALKYPSLELVVGLELDQTIVRKSFQYFQTQPHFDDDRVEWWFGDATKSLLLLPKDYWGSFDLVLVDLSETVMSLSVTNELDVFDALRLLLQPKGVMVKNELYMEKLSKLFDYSTQIYYQSPIICSQALAMGSNSVDFFRHEPKDHEIETLLYEPLHTSDDHLDYLHDYRINDARAQGKCGDLKIPEKPTEQETAAGIVSIVNAEKTSVPLEGTVIAEKIRDAIKAQGFSLMSPPVFDNGSVYAVMNEGYVVARLWPDETYCAFDINLWGGFSRMKSLQAALVGVVESQLVSSYLIVVGGMFGSSTWKEDIESMGPQIVRTRNCDEPEPLPEVDISTEAMISVALEESINLALSENLNTMVFCGMKEQGKCLAADLLKEHDNVVLLEQLWTCEGLDGENLSDESMIACEIQTMKDLLGENSGTYQYDLLVVDSSVPYPMLQILHSILEHPRERLALINHERNMFIAISAEASAEPWRMHFLDRYRKQHETDPLAMGEIHLKNGQNTVAIGIVSAGDINIAYNLETYEGKLQKTFESMEKEVKVQVRSITGGLFRFQEEWDPIEFDHTDYDTKPGLDQFYEQKALGRQNIFQLVPAEGVTDLDMSSTKLRDILKKGLDHLHFSIRSHHQFSGFGEGTVQIYTCKEGQVIGVWDGRNHVDINFFTYEELPEGPDNFMSAVLHFTEGKAIVGLRDDQPRGVGRVMNFQSDILSGKTTVR